MDIFSLGVEKIALSSLAIDNPDMIAKIAKVVGNQSVVVVMDVRKKLFSGKYELYSINGTKPTNLDPVEYAIKMQMRGAGEIVLNSIDQDGMMNGYDYNLIRKVRASISIPMTVMGGAGSLEHLGEVIKEHGIIGAAAGSLFVFKGKYRAVLINYPTKLDKSKLIEDYFTQVPK